MPRRGSCQPRHRIDDFFVGIINSFQLEHHASPNAVLIFPLEQLAPALAKRKLWNPDEVIIVLISDDQDTKTPFVTIQNVRLVIARSPITRDALMQMLP